MTQTLNRDLEKLDSDIRAAVVGGDEFLYSKLNRAKDELLQKLWFAESRNLKSELEDSQADRAFNLSLRGDLQTELTAAAEVVADIHKRLVAAQRIHEEIKLRQYFNDSAIEQGRRDIQDLKAKLQSHINTKLGENNDEQTN